MGSTYAAISASTCGYVAHGGHSRKYDSVDDVYHAVRRTVDDCQLETDGAGRYNKTERCGAEGR
jgi:hypothetical protein